MTDAVAPKRDRLRDAGSRGQEDEPAVRHGDGLARGQLQGLDEVELVAPAQRALLERGLGVRLTDVLGEGQLVVVEQRDLQVGVAHDGAATRDLELVEDDAESSERAAEVRLVELDLDLEGRVGQGAGWP